MEIVVTGAGNIVEALGYGWTMRGHEVRYGSPNPADPRYGPPVTSPAEASAGAEAIVLATP